MGWRKYTELGWPRKVGRKRRDWGWSVAGISRARPVARLRRRDATGQRASVQQDAAGQSRGGEEADSRRCSTQGWAVGAGWRHEESGQQGVREKRGTSTCLTRCVELRSDGGG